MKSELVWLLASTFAVGWSAAGAFICWRLGVSLVGPLAALLGLSLFTFVLNLLRLKGGTEQ